MKKIILFLFFAFIGQATFAQNPLATPIAPGKKASTAPDNMQKTYFCCRTCDYTALAARSCPIHQSPLIQVGHWYCPVDGKTDARAGKCKIDQTPLVRMEMKYKTLTPKPAELKKDEPVRK